MARQSGSQCNCVHKYYTVLKNFKAQCKICKETFANEEKNLKYHLKQHEISAKEFGKFDRCTEVCNIRDKRLNRSNVLIKQMKAKHLEETEENIRKDSRYKCIKPYCTYLEGYKAKCKFCSKIYSVASSPTTIKKHLKMKHSKKITGIVKKKSQRSWMWQYIKLKDCKAKCNFCDQVYDIFWETTKLEKHLIDYHKINIYSRTEKKIEEDKTNRKTTELVSTKDVEDTAFNEIISSFIKSLKEMKKKNRLNN